MFTKRITLFRLFGFSVAIDLSWLVLAILVTWSLAEGVFPILYSDLAPANYWVMGILGLVGLMFSIVIHELAHSLVAKAYGMPIEGITLFIFGGVAEMRDEPTGPKAEFLMAIVGPLMSLAVGGVSYSLALGTAALSFPVEISGVLRYLATINVVLAVFNMVPAFPLDGGRVLRAALWGWKGQYVWATRIAADFGSGFGLLLIVLAVMSVLAGNFIAGMWWFLIGMFVRGAAQATYQQTLIHRALEGITISRFMTANPVTVPPSLTIRALVDEVFYRHYFKTYPVVDGGRILGCVNLQDVERLPRERWQYARVSDIMQTRSEANTIAPATDAATALTLMLRTQTPRLLVAEGDYLVGIVSQTDIFRYLAVKLQLEGRARGATG